MVGLRKPRIIYEGATGFIIKCIRCGNQTIDIITVSEVDGLIFSCEECGNKVLMEAEK